MDSGNNKKRDWLAEILLNATKDRKKINSIKLPGEPDYKEKPVRVDDASFGSSVGNLLGRYNEKLESEAPKDKDKKQDGSGWKEEDKPRAGINRPHDYLA